ncbi:MAG: tryptophanase [Candidatus Kariarchaeaceae archaeon]|jgi:tryptophanase
MVDYLPPPYRIKMVEPISLPSKESRRLALKKAHYNIFNLRADEVFIDLLTDSGTGAMSQNQWASLMVGDESYANSTSFDRFKSVIQEITGFSEVIPTHQGRAAENVLIGHLLKNRPNSLVISNQSFDTTIGHILYNKSIPVDIVIDEGRDPTSLHPFKGNIDIEKLKSILQEKKEEVSIITLVLTNNAGGGQPVSVENVQAVSKLAKEYGIPFFLDIARVIENCYFIKTRDANYNHKSLQEILKIICDEADGVWMSAKKDASVNIGGFLALKDPKLASELRERLIMFEGFPSYGGLAGRDLEAIATGLEEALGPDVIAHRINQVEYLVRRLQEEKVPVVLPPGGHAAFIDAQSFLPHIPPHQFPAHALVCELYLHGGIRAVEIGSLMFGKITNGKFIPANLELVRLTIPRRTYEKAHFDYIIETVKEIKKYPDTVKGYKITEESEFLRHFTCKLEQV